MQISRRGIKRTGTEQRVVPVVQKQDFVRPFAVRVVVGAGKQMGDRWDYSLRVDHQ